MTLYDENYHADQSRKILKTDVKTISAMRYYQMHHKHKTITKPVFISLLGPFTLPCSIKKNTSGTIK